MKPGIHPNWYPDALVTCACGNSWTTGSTRKEIHTDVCNKCHPFFTGEQRIVDTAGQVERFMKRMSAKEQIAATLPATEDKKAKQEKRRDRKAGTTVSLKPLLEAPANLPLAVASDAPVVESAPVAEKPVAKTQPVIAQPVAEAQEPVAQEPVAELIASEPAPVVAVEEPVAVAQEIAPINVQVPTEHAVVEASATVVGDNLTIIEGIGPKIAKVLKDAGVATLAQVASSSADKLSEILKAANLNLADPGTWPQQAQLAVEGKTEELKKLQDELSGGRRAKKKTAKPKADSAETE